MSSVKHQPPRQSASAMYRQDLCPSSYARELEYFRWAEENGIAGIVSDRSADRGTDLHAILAKIPFAGRDWGVEPFDLRATVEKTAIDLGKAISGYDSWLLSEMIKRRDQLIDAVIEMHPGGRAAVEEVELFLDERRMRIPLDEKGCVMRPSPANPDDWPDNISGLGDVIVIARNKHAAVAGVLDYKSGNQEYDSADNRQLDSLLAQLFLEERLAGRQTFSGALAAIAAESDVLEGNGLRIAKYEDVDLHRIELWQLKVANLSTPLAMKMKKVRLEPKPELQLELDTAAKVGSHCLHCRGKVCCGALKLKAAQFEYAITQKYDHLLNDPSVLGPKPPTVKTETLSQTLALTTAIEQWAVLYSKLREETEMLVVQLLEKGEKVDGAELKPGRNRITLLETDLKTLHARLGPVLGETLEQFAVGVTGKPLASAVRAHVADKLGWPEMKVVDTLTSLIGAGNPLAMKPEKSSVRVTAELADIIQIVESEIAATHAAGGGGIAPKATSMPGPIAGTPAGAAPGAVEPPKKRRSRRSAGTPALAEAGQDAEIVVGDAAAQAPQVATEEPLVAQVGNFM